MNIETNEVIVTGKRHGYTAVGMMHWLLFTRIRTRQETFTNPYDMLNDGSHDPRKAIRCVLRHLSDDVEKRTGKPIRHHLL